LRGEQCAVLGALLSGQLDRATISARAVRCVNIRPCDTGLHGARKSAGGIGASRGLCGRGGGPRSSASRCRRTVAASATTRR